MVISVQEQFQRYLRRRAYVKVLSGCSGIHEALPCALAECPCLTQRGVTPKLIDLRALPSLEVQVPTPTSAWCHREIWECTIPFHKTWFTWDEPQRGGCCLEDRGLWGAPQVRDRPWTVWVSWVAEALLMPPFLWRKNHFKPVVTIISKQVSAKWVAKSSNDSSPGLFSESQIANSYLSSPSRVTVPHFK